DRDAGILAPLQEAGAVGRPGPVPVVGIASTRLGEPPVAVDDHAHVSRHGVAVELPDGTSFVGAVERVAHSLSFRGALSTRDTLPPRPVSDPTRGSPDPSMANLRCRKLPWTDGVPPHAVVTREGARLRRRRSR